MAPQGPHVCSPLPGPGSPICAPHPAQRPCQAALRPESGLSSRHPTTDPPLPSAPCSGPNPGNGLPAILPPSSHPRGCIPDPQAPSCCGMSPPPSQTLGGPCRGSPSPASPSLPPPPPPHPRSGSSPSSHRPNLQARVPAERRSPRPAPPGPRGLHGAPCPVGGRHEGPARGAGGGFEQKRGRGPLRLAPTSVYWSGPRPWLRPADPAPCLCPARCSVMAHGPRGQGLSVCAGSTVLTRNRIASDRFRETAPGGGRRAAPSQQQAAGGPPGRGPVPPPGRGPGGAPGAARRGPAKGGEGAAGRGGGKAGWGGLGLGQCGQRGREDAGACHTPSRPFDSPFGDFGKTHSWTLHTRGGERRRGPA